MKSLLLSIKTIGKLNSQFTPNLLYIFKVAYIRLNKKSYI